MIIRKGQTGDCMYFIAAGEVEVDLPGKKVKARRRRVLRRNGAARQQFALRQHHHHARVEAIGARSRGFPSADGAASRSRRDHRRRSQAARAGKQIMRETEAPPRRDGDAPLLDIDGARATIRLNRPKHLNRLQADDLNTLLELFDRIEADAAMRVLVLTGTGRAFSAGYDLNSVAERAASAVGTAKRRFGVRNRGQPAGGPRAYRRFAGSTAASMAARPIWRWPAISGSASTAARCSCRRRGSGLHYYNSGIKRYVSRLGVDNAKKLFLTAREDRRGGDAADRLSHRDGADRGARPGGRPARGHSRRQRPGRDARHEARNQRIRPRRARSRKPPTAATATACAAPKSRKASRRSRKSGHRSFEQGLDHLVIQQRRIQLTA